MHEYLELIRLPHADYTWKRVSRFGLIGWELFFALFLLHAYRSPDGWTWIDNINLLIHEAGHALFSYLGYTAGLWGGTLFQLMVPLLLAIGFAWRGDTFGTAFAAFFFFENFLNIARYMADARAMQLDLVTVGDAGDAIIHDWFLIFSSLGLLQQDLKIAAVTRAIGWLGMVAVIAWLAWMWRRHPEE